MKRTLIVAALGVGLAAGFASVAIADDDDRGRGDFGVAPFHVGQGGLATWARDSGEPDQRGDPRQYGLYLQKEVATVNFTVAGANITGITPRPAASLEVLAFDISGVVGQPFNTAGFPANGYCGAGAPRFNVFSTAGTCFLGCNHGDKTQDPNTGWWEIKFVTPFTQYPGCGGGVTGTVTDIQIVFDEGNDVDLTPFGGVGLSSGNVVIDNIRVNKRTVGKPDDDRRD